MFFGMGLDDDMLMRATLSEVVEAVEDHNHRGFKSYDKGFRMVPGIGLQ